MNVEKSIEVVRTICNRDFVGLIADGEEIGNIKSILATLLSELEKVTGERDWWRKHGNGQGVGMLLEENITLRKERDGFKAQIERWTEGCNGCDWDKLRKENTTLKEKVKGLSNIHRFVIDNRAMWNDKEWDLIRMKWFKIEEKAQAIHDHIQGKG